MKLKFKNQQFQTNAVNAVVGLFEGQKQGHGTFTITGDNQLMLQDGGDGVELPHGYTNVLTISDEQILENMQAVQRHNSLGKTDDLEGRQLSIEMETGTGYVQQSIM